MNLNNYALVEDHVQQLLANIQQINEERVREYISRLNLANKSIEEQVEKLYFEQLSIDETAKSFEKPEYISLAKYPETITKIIYHRLLFHEENECHILAEANLINQKNAKIRQLLETAKVNFPLFTYDDFIQGKFNVVFYKLKQRPNSTSEDEYFKMRTWQNDQISAAISIETNHFVKAFQQTLKDELSKTECITQEQLQLQNIFNHGKDYSKDQLVSELFKLRGLTNSLVPDNLSFLHKSMIKFLKNETDHSFFTPENLTGIISKYKRRKSTPQLSYPPILCFSLFQYDDWLQRVTDGGIDINSIINLNFQGLFDQSIKDAIAGANESIRDFNKRIFALNTAEEFKDIILAELEKLRISLKDGHVQRYYDLLIDEQLLKSQFIANCIIEGKPEEHSLALGKAIVIAEKTDFFLEDLASKYFDQVLLKSLKALPTINLQIIDVINSMVPDSLTIQKMLEASAKTIGELGAGKKPTIFILQDLCEKLLALYKLSEEALSQYLNRFNDDIRYEYASHAIRELNGKFRFAQSNKYDLDFHFQSLKEILQQELEIIKSIARPVDISKLLKQKPVVPKTFNFGYNKSTTKPIDDIVQALILNREIEFLDYRTAPEDLIALLTTKDIDNLPYKPIYINCQTNQFRYIIIKFKNHLPAFNPTSIEKCGRFFSKNGKPYLANNLNPSKVDIPTSKIVIDQIFQKVQ